MSASLAERAALAVLGLLCILPSLMLLYGVCGGQPVRSFHAYARKTQMMTSNSINDPRR